MAVKYMKYLDHAVGVAIVAFLCHIIGFSTDFWVHMKETITIHGVTTYYTYYVGLWRYCKDSRRYGMQCSTPVKSDIFNTDWYKATEALEVLAFLTLVAVLVVYVLQKTRLKHKDLSIIICVICGVAATFIFLGIIVFAFRVDEAITDASSNYHFSFGLCVISGLLMIISGILVVIDKAIVYY